MVIKTSITDLIILIIAGVLGLLGLTELNKKRLEQQQPQPQTQEQQPQSIIQAALEALIPQISSYMPASTPNTPTVSLTGGIPPLYQKAADQLGINPLDIYEMSVNGGGDGKTLLVRMKDGRILSTSNPAYLAHMELYLIGAKTYYIKIGDEPFKITPGDEFHNPTVYDRDGFENTGTGPGGQYYPQWGITATSFLDATKQKFGKPDDVLGLKGYKAYAESMTHQTLNWNVVYEVTQPITIPTTAPAGTTTKLSSGATITVVAPPQMTPTGPTGGAVIYTPPKPAADVNFDDASQRTYWGQQYVKATGKTVYDTGTLIDWLNAQGKSVNWYGTVYR